MKVYTHARDRGLVVATPNVTLAEWWRGRSDRRESVLRPVKAQTASALFVTEVKAQTASA